MDPPKYAKLENERRFLVLKAPALTGAPYRLIEDLYLEAGRLRLRRITDGETVQWKLCKKYGGDDPVSAPVTNLYLAEPEYAAFAGLPGWPLRKRRYRIDGFSLDVFEGPLSGLMLAEVEAGSRAAVLALTPPVWADAEVTAEPFFTGGNLCRISSAELEAALASARPGHLG
jgi:hypothetical protein